MERKQEESTEKQELSEVERHYSSCSTMTEISADDLAKAASDNDVQMEEISRLKGENAPLQKQIATLKEAMITSESLNHNDAKVKYYKGLPSYVVLKVVFDFVSPCVTNYSRTSLPLIDQFIMVLVRLRLNMDIEHLSYHFRIHTSNVSRTIRRWITVLYECLKVFVKWPEREQLYKTMPSVFKRLRKCAIIIDCFEVFVKRPSALKARAQTWSNYKSHNTCKFLIGISPQGSISFVSQAWWHCTG